VAKGKIGDAPGRKDYIKGMEAFFTILMFIALGLTLLVLFVGIGAFALGGKFNQKYSNKLMRARVLMQGIAIILFAVIMLLSGR
tara:strand:- start:498 stop:749 length:252 start_codon:yes stop_codon:yes gene_type:complete